MQNDDLNFTRTINLKREIESCIIESPKQTFNDNHPIVHILQAAGFKRLPSYIKGHRYRCVIDANNKSFWLCNATARKFKVYLLGVFLSLYLDENLYRKARESIEEYEECEERGTDLERYPMTQCKKDIDFFFEKIKIKTDTQVTISLQKNQTIKINTEA